MKSKFLYICTLPYVFLRVLYSVSFTSLVKLIKIAYAFFVKVKRKTTYNKLPPILLLSVTGKCNLGCSQCFVNPSQNQEYITIDLFRNILDEAVKEKVSLIGLTGGEPLLRSDVFKLIQQYPSLYFEICTNGILLTEEIAKQAATAQNITFLIGLDGTEKQTNSRRGQGVYSSVLPVMQRLKQYRIPFGVSIMVTSKNFYDVVDENWIVTLRKNGCLFLVYVPYTLSGRGLNRDLILTPELLTILGKHEYEIQKKYSILVLSQHWARHQCNFNTGNAAYIHHTGELGICPAFPFSNVFISSNESITSKLKKSTFLQFIYAYHRQEATCLFRDNPNKLLDFAEHYKACSKHNYYAFIESKEFSTNLTNHSRKLQ
jgi:MoaA/NifB/PqqE/SkfB family radical SAM enzyme